MEPTAFLLRNRQDERHSDRERAIRATDFVVGERVRIVTGQLSGLRGVLKAQADDGKWVLDASEVARGVLICIRGQQLSRD